MPRNVKIWIFAACLVLVWCSMGCARGPEPPNIVIILADDLGYSDIGAYGGEIRTPSLDGLALGGLRFQRFYNGGRCCPTRASLLTGRYPHAVGMGAMVSARDALPQPGPYQGYLSEESPTIAEMLRSSGYRTYMSGKWHVGERPEHWPRQRGFDRYFGLISGASSYFEIIRDQPRIRAMALDDTPWSPPEEGFYITDAFTDYAVEFLQEHPEDDPFFLYLAYTAPHWPLHALPEDIDRYRDKYEGGWDVLRQERYARQLDMGLIDSSWLLPPRPEHIPSWESEPDKDNWTHRMAVYAAMVDRMDQGIGRVVDQLQSMGELDNTLILFLSDNGGCAESVAGRNLHDSTAAIGARGSYVAYQEAWANASNTPFRLYKQWMHEGGIATPLIAHWPSGIAEPGRITDFSGHVMDLMATISEVTGSPHAGTDGQSLVPVLAESNEIVTNRTLYWEHIGHRAIREGSWKLVYDRRIGEWELYDLSVDPTELNDISEEHPSMAESLAAKWQNWADSAGVRIR